MRSCPNCGGGLKFDIGSQKLKCPSCSSMFPVGEIPEVRAAKADGTMDAMIFSCPQCGGEVWSTSETAAGFCSFCGASVQLEGRMAAEKMPEQIIPFQITGKECGKRFREHVKKYFFSPSDLSQENAKMEFRGIYMPYWDYTVHQEAHIDREYRDEHRSGDYRIVRYYDFDWDLNEDIEAIQHDASRSFNDDVGVAIAPFEPEKRVAFDSGYMEGFYGDVADTQWEDYADFAIDEAVGYTERAIRTKTKGTRTDKGPTGNDEFHGRIIKRQLSLFPVWFLSYRSGNRVAYSAVNGQTGKVHVDLPVSPAKFAGLTAAITAVLFVFFLQLFTPSPQTDVGIAMIMSIAASAIFTVMTQKILERDELLEKKEKKEGSNRKKGLILGCTGSCLIVIVLFVSILVGLVFFIEIAAAVIALWALVRYLQRNKLFVKANGQGVFPSPLLAFAAALLGIAVVLWNPVSDFWYYGITALAMAAAAISLGSIIALRNMLSTRRLPQFDTHKGGDHRAR
ncbi:MAG: hypothetical protein IJ682_09240 [Lachnospiraceae bacterium]|nr:hypothetical protein [Lachnospiraceae bacterium]